MTLVAIEWNILRCTSMHIWISLSTAVLLQFRQMWAESLTNCIYWVHTHDQKGIIHIESPENRNFTLGEFFDIWGQNFSNNQIFDNIVEESDNNILSVYVNGKKISTGNDYRQITINAHDEIAIVYGKPPASIPSNYEFPEGMRSTVNGSTI